MKREIGRYTCMDAGGTLRTVVEYQNFSTFRPINGRPSEVPGIKDYRLSDGRHVNWVDDMTFQIVETDELLRRPRD
jgi:hypothetical protein